MLDNNMELTQKNFIYLGSTQYFIYGGNALQLSGKNKFQNIET